MNLIPLVFVKPFAGDKRYAQTPMGELAYSDAQGLYEWHGGHRIDYSGGDKQCSSGGVRWTIGVPQGAGAQAKAAGRAAALDMARRGN